MKNWTAAIVFLLCPHSAGFAEDIKILSWNVESDRPGSDNGNEPATIAAELTALQTSRGPYDLIALSEVRATSSGTYKSAVDASGVEYLAFTSASGNSDRMMLLIRKDRFDLVGSGATELVNDGRSGGITFPGGASRRPFLIRLKDTKNGDQELIFMVNHLTRGNQLNRRTQAEGLREWARLQTVPIIAAGDYNFDFDFANLTGNRSMSIFMRLDADDKGKFVWRWIIPDAEFEIEGDTDATRRVGLLARFVDTNWSGNSSDSFRDSMLDFIFVAKGARNWKASSTVIVRQGDFPDDVSTSDHRPLEAVLDPAGSADDVGGPIDD